MMNSVCSFLNVSGGSFCGGWVGQVFLAEVDYSFCDCFYSVSFWLVNVISGFQKLTSEFIEAFLPSFRLKVFISLQQEMLDL